MYNVRLNPFSMSGPFAVLMTYLTELHGRQYRQRIMMMVGIMFSLATLSLPGLAMGILPQSWDTNILGLSCKYNITPLFFAYYLPACAQGVSQGRRIHLVVPVSLWGQLHVLDILMRYIYTISKILVLSPNQLITTAAAQSVFRPCSSANLCLGLLTAVQILLTVQLIKHYVA